MRGNRRRGGPGAGDTVNVSAGLVTVLALGWLGADSLLLPQRDEAGARRLAKRGSSGGWSFNGQARWRPPGAVQNGARRDLARRRPAGFTGVCTCGNRATQARQQGGRRDLPQQDRPEEELGASGLHGRAEEDRTWTIKSNGGAESGARRQGSMAAELHPVAMARPLFILKKERPRGEVLERERATVERERNGGEVGLAGVVSDAASRR